MTTYLDVQQFETYVSACARNSGVTVHWDKPTATPRTNGKQMWLPAITSVTSNEWMTRMRYFVKHETSHVVHSDFDYLNKVKPSGLLALINNLIEDHRIDYRNDSEYRGDNVISNEFWYLYGDDIQKNIASTDKELSEQQLLTLPLFVWDASLRDWINSSSVVQSNMQACLDAVGQERLDKLAKYSDELVYIRELGEAAEVFDLAKRILQDLYDQDPEDYQGKGEADGEGSGDGKKGDGEGEDGEPVADDVDRLISVSKLVKAMGHEHKASRTGIHMENIVAKGGGYAIPKPQEYVVLDFDKPIPTKVAEHMDSGYLRASTVENYITSNARHMSNKLRLKLQTRSRDRYEYGKKRGNLHNGSLHRVLSGNDKLASKVFRQRVVSDTNDTAVCLLVDCSGSMSGSKFDMACAGAGALGDALKPLNIAYSIYGFTNTVEEEDPMIWVFSEFGSKTPTRELVARFKTASGHLMQNSDGDAIAYATARLGQRKEHRKVLLVLSDGSPAGRDHCGDIVTYTKQTVEHAEKLGVDVYGIGIMDRNVQKFYKKHVVVDDLESLAPTILSIVDRSI
jgi:uncharacterized protein YegL